MTFGTTRTQIVIGKSSARVVRVRREDGVLWIDKAGPSPEIERDTAVLEWCAGRLPVAKVLRKDSGFLAMSALPGVNLVEGPMECAVRIIAEALDLVHAIPIEECPFISSWASRLVQAEVRVRAGLVDESDFDEANLGRAASDIPAELQALPGPPDLACFTHGDACLPNFLTQGGQLTGIVDLGRAGRHAPCSGLGLGDP